MGKNRSDRGSAQGSVSGRPEQRSYGRRMGRRLRCADRHRLKEALPECRINLDAAGRVFRGEAPIAGPYVLEVGFGGGEHLAQLAAESPEMLFLGAEPFVNGVAKLLRLAEEASLSNIGIFPDDVRLLLPFLPESSCVCVYLLHPDPWPKARHYKRRLVRDAFLVMLERILKDGARVHFATDDSPMAAWILMHMQRSRHFHWENGVDYLGIHAKGFNESIAPELQTRYMKKGAQRGAESVRLTFRYRSQVRLDKRFD